MPASNPFAYLPPDVQRQLLGLAAGSAGGTLAPGIAGLGAQLTPQLAGQPVVSPSGPNQLAGMLSALFVSQQEDNRVAAPQDERRAAQLGTTPYPKLRASLQNATDEQLAAIARKYKDQPHVMQELSRERQARQLNKGW